MVIRTNLFLQHLVAANSVVLLTSIAAFGSDDVTVLLHTSMDAALLRLSAIVLGRFTKCTAVIGNWGDEEARPGAGVYRVNELFYFSIF